MSGLLNETFAVYGKHFWRFVGMVAIVHVPVSLLTLVIMLVMGTGEATVIVAGLVSFSATVFVWGSAVFAVGQHYLLGDVRIGECYKRAWWRVLSLMLLGVIVATALLVAPGVLTRIGEPLVSGFVSLLAIPAIVLSVYWSVSVPTVIMENCGPLGALRRSTALIRGSWWRVFGITIVFGLVVLGLAILLTLPFALGTKVVGADIASGVPAVIQFLVSLVVETVVPPVAFIAGTLLYYDLRVRKEAFDFATLSRELGIAAA